MKKILYIVIITALLLFTALNICSLFDVSFFGYRIFKIVTGSMEPKLHVNDILLIQEVDEYKIGDIITYRYEDEYVTHRVISVEGDQIVTKGDANNTTDEPISKDIVVGKMLKRLDIITYLNNNPIVWGIAIIVCFVLLMILPNHKRRKGKIIDEEVI